MGILQGCLLKKTGEAILFHFISQFAWDHSAGALGHYDMYIKATTMHWAGSEQLFRRQKKKERRGLISTTAKATLGTVGPTWTKSIWDGVLQ